ncbi:MAG: LCP family protein [Spirochaetaceae bacterium]|nr:LCP family protein [Spirochaetaceae bacterium]
MAQSRHEKSYLFIIGILIILIALAVILFFALQTDPIANVLENNQLLNVLFVLQKDGKPLFTDVFIYYPESERGALFNIPGNTGLILGSLDRVDRIDAVYTEKGIETYKKEIEALTDITIPFTIEMSIDQFSALTDLLGGLNVFIPSPIDVVNGDVRHILPSGSVDLDGEKMISYLSYTDDEETSDNIQDRMEGVMVAFLHALNKKSAFVLNKNVFPVVSRYLKANIDNKALYRLISLISAIDSERLVPQTISGKRREVDGQVLLFPDYNGELIKEVFKQTMISIASTGGIANDRVYVLEIQNGTSQQGLARNTGGLLQSYGYDVLSMINADHDYDKTQVIDHIGNAKVAQAIADIIHCKNIITEEVPKDANSTETEDSPVDFTIILGRDFTGRYVR